MLSVGELRRAIASLPDDARVEVVVGTEAGSEVGVAPAVAQVVWGPDGLGFCGLRIEATVAWGDLVTSEAIGEVPAWILERVLETGGVPTRDEIEEGMHG